MRDVKSLLLLIVSFLLFVVSFVLLWTWGYRIYVKKPAQSASVPAVNRELPPSPGSTRDSLQTMYTATINELDSRLDSTWNKSDSLQGQLDVKLGEFYRLKNEIALLLKNHETGANLSTARQKIGELQQRVKDLLDRNTDIERENRKLAAVLEQLTGTAKGNEVPGIQRVNYETKTPPDKNIPTELLTISDLKLSAMTNENDRETETNLAGQTEKLVGSITIRNNNSTANNTDLMVVVLQPDGKVIKNSTWESGSFNTNEGKKIYSYKLHFDSRSGEAKRLLFSLNADRYLSGTYTMQVYHNGILIGRLVKTLS